MTTVIPRQEPDPLREEVRAPTLATAGPDDLAPLAEMLGRCSARTRYHRFHGITDGLAYLERQLGAASDIVLAARAGVRCVGLGVMANDGNGIWDLGVVVEDRWQRHGVGSRLVSALAAEASRRRISTIRADILYEDSYLVAMLRRIGPVRIQVDGQTISVEIQLGGPAPLISRNREPAGSDMGGSLDSLRADPPRFQGDGDVAALHPQRKPVQ